MEFRANGPATSLLRAATVIGSQAGIKDILQRIRLRSADTTDGGMILSAESTDFDVFFRGSVPAQSSVPGAVVVPATTLRNILPKGRKPSTVSGVETPATSGPGATLCIGFQSPVPGIIGSSGTTLPLFPDADFPDMPSDNRDVRETPLTLASVVGGPVQTVAQFLDWFAFLDSATGPEKTRYAFNAIRIGPDGSGVATDGKRIAFLPGIPLGAPQLPILLPVHSLALICKAFKAFPGPTADLTFYAETLEEEYEPEKGKKAFRTICPSIRIRAIGDDSAEAVVTIRTLDGNFPEFGGLITKRLPYSAILPTADWTPALESTLPVLEKGSETVILSPAPAGIRLSAGSQDRGTVDTTLPASETLQGPDTILLPDHADGTPGENVPAPPPEMGFNPLFLVDMLAALDSPMITMEYADTHTCARFSPCPPDGRVIVIMPVSREYFRPAPATT